MSKLSGSFLLLTSRFTALFLSLALSLPSPTFALKPQEPSEGSSLHVLTQRITAGMEENDRGLKDKIGRLFELYRKVRLDREKRGLPVKNSLFSVRTDYGVHRATDETDFFEEILPAIGNPQMVLDLGGGRGVFALMLAIARPDIARIVSIEGDVALWQESVEVLALAEKEKLIRVGRVNLYRGDFYDQKFIPLFQEEGLLIHYYEAGTEDEKRLGNYLAEHVTQPGTRILFQKVLSYGFLPGLSGNLRFQRTQALHTWLLETYTRLAENQAGMEEAVNGNVVGANGKMFYAIYPTAAHIGDVLARRISDGLDRAHKRGHDYILAIPRGSTFAPTLQALIRLRRGKDPKGWHWLRVVLLNDYVNPRTGKNVPPESPDSAVALTLEMFRPSPKDPPVIREDRVWVPQVGKVTDLLRDIRKLGGIDLMLIAVGPEGSVGHNFPPEEGFQGDAVGRPFDHDKAQPIRRKYFEHNERAREWQRGVGFTLADLVSFVELTPESQVAFVATGEAKREVIAGFAKVRHSQEHLDELPVYFLWKPGIVLKTHLYLDPPTGVGLLTGILEEPSSGPPHLWLEHEDAASNLGPMGPLARPAVGVLVKALQNDHPSVREHAAWSLGQIGPGASEAVPALIAIVRGGLDPPQDEDSRRRVREDAKEVRPAAIRALSQIDGSEAVTALVDLLQKDDNKRIRAAAAMGLAHVGQQAVGAIPSLLKALNDFSSDVRKAAVIALGNIIRFSPPGVSRLRGSLQRLEAVDPIQAVRDTARSVLDRMPSASGMEERGIQRKIVKWGAVIAITLGAFYGAYKVGERIFTPPPVAQKTVQREPVGALAPLRQRLGPDRQLELMVWDARDILRLDEDLFSLAVPAGIDTVSLSGYRFRQLSSDEQRQKIITQASRAGIKNLEFIDGEKDWGTPRTWKFVAEHYRELIAQVRRLDLGALNVGFATDAERYLDPDWNGDLSSYLNLLEEVILPQIQQLAVQKLRPDGRSVIRGALLTRFEPWWYENGRRTDSGVVIRGLRPVPGTQLAGMIYRDTREEIEEFSRIIRRRAAEEGVLYSIVLETIPPQEAGTRSYAGKVRRIGPDLIWVFDRFSKQDQDRLGRISIHTGSPVAAVRILKDLLKPEPSSAPPQPRPIAPLLQPAPEFGVKAGRLKDTEFTPKSMTLDLLLDKKLFGRKLVAIPVVQIRFDLIYPQPRGDGSVLFPVGADGQVTVRTADRSPFKGGNTAGRAVVLVEEARAAEFFRMYGEGTRRLSVGNGNLILGIISVGNDGKASVVDRLPFSGLEEKRVVIQGVPFNVLESKTLPLQVNLGDRVEPNRKPIELFVGNPDPTTRPPRGSEVVMKGLAFSEWNYVAVSKALAGSFARRKFSHPALSIRGDAAPIFSDSERLGNERLQNERLELCLLAAQLLRDTRPLNAVPEFYREIYINWLLEHGVRHLLRRSGNRLELDEIKRFLDRALDAGMKRGVISKEEVKNVQEHLSRIADEAAVRLGDFVDPIEREGLVRPEKVQVQSLLALIATLDDFLNYGLRVEKGVAPLTVAFLKDLIAVQAITDVDFAAKGITAETVSEVNNWLKKELVGRVQKDVEPEKFHDGSGYLAQRAWDARGALFGPGSVPMETVGPFYPFEAGLEERPWPGWIKPYQAEQLSYCLFRALTEVKTAQIPLSKLDRSSLEMICQGVVTWLKNGALQKAEKETETFSLDQAMHFFNNVPDLLGILQETPSFEVRLFWLHGLIQTLHRVWERFPLEASRENQISFLIVESASSQSSRSAQEARPFINAKLSDEEQRGIASRLLEMLLAPPSSTAGLEEVVVEGTRLRRGGRRFEGYVAVEGGTEVPQSRRVLSLLEMHERTILVPLAGLEQAPPVIYKSANLQLSPELVTAVGRNRIVNLPAGLEEVKAFWAEPPVYGSLILLDVPSGTEELLLPPGWREFATAVNLSPDIAFRLTLPQLAGLEEAARFHGGLLGIKSILQPDVDLLAVREAA